MLDLIVIIIFFIAFAIYLIIIVSEKTDISFKRKLVYVSLIIFVPVVGSFYVFFKTENKKEKKSNDDLSSSSNLTSDDKYNPHYDGIDIELGD